jgi:hypothetical protein
MHAQVAHQRPHPRPVAGRSARVYGEAGLGRRPQAQRRRSARCSVTRRPSGGRSNTCRASTPTTLAPTKSAPHPPHQSGACRPPRRAPAPAPGGRLGRRAACRAGDLRPAHRCGAQPPRAAQPIRGRRLGGVGGILAEPTFQLGHPRLQRGDQAGLFGVGRAQFDDGRSLHRDGGYQISFRGRIGASTTTSRQARLPVGRTEQLPHKPQTVKSLTARRQVLNSYPAR